MGSSSKLTSFSPSQLLERPYHYVHVGAVSEGTHNYNDFECSPWGAPEFAFYFRNCLTEVQFRSIPIMNWKLKAQGRSIDFLQLSAGENSRVWI